MTTVLEMQTIKEDEDSDPEPEQHLLSNREENSEDDDDSQQQPPNNTDNVTENNVTSQQPNNTEEGTQNNTAEQQKPNYRETVQQDEVSSLREVCRYGNKTEVIKILENLNLDPNKQYRNLRPIHWAAESGNVSALTTLLKERSIDIAYVDGYHRTALHLAARSGNHEALKLLIKENKIDMNAVDKQGRTAFHHAAETSVEGNGTEGRFLRCLVLLMGQPNLEINKPDFYGRSALGRALRKSHERRVEVILKHHGGHKLNLDYCLVDGGKTIRETILENFRDDFIQFMPECLMEKIDSPKPEARLLAALQHDLLTDFKNTLQNNPELIHYHFSEPYHCTCLELACIMKERTSFVETMLRSGGDPNIRNLTSAIPLLHMTAERLNLPVLGTLLHTNEININAEGSLRGTVLHWLALNKCNEEEGCPLETCLSMIMDSNEVDIDAKDSRGDTPLHIAVRWNNLNMAVNLLVAGASVDERNVNDHTPLYVSALCGHKDAAITLLKFGADINAENEHGTPLHIAAQQGQYELALLLLKQGANFMYETQGKPLLQYIDSHILETFFDECIERNNKSPKSPQYMLTFRYQFFKGKNNFESEMHSLMRMSELPELRHLLKHPLISSILYFKWDRACKVFYYNIIAYICFLVCLTLYVISLNNSIASRGIGTKNSTNFKRMESNIHIHNPPPDVGNTIIYSFLWITLCVIIGRESVQFTIDRNEYLHNPGNILDISILGTTIWCCCTTYIPVIQHVSSIAILLAWIEFLILIGRLPAVSVQLEMLKKVSWTFLKYLLCYLPLIVAFALSFNVLFHEKQTKPETGISEVFLNADINSFLYIFKTLIMFTGEFEANELPFSSTPVTSHIVFSLFVFLVALALLNLLNGLAVSDTQTIKDDAETLSLVSRAKLVLQTETMASHYQKNKYLKEIAENFCFQFRLLPQKRFYVFPNQNYKMCYVPGEMEMGKMDPSIARRAIAVASRSIKKS